MYGIIEFIFDTGEKNEEIMLLLIPTDNSNSNSNMSYHRHHHHCLRNVNAVTKEVV